MKLPRIKVRAALLAVLVVAVDLAIVRAVLARGEAADFLFVPVVGTLPMVSILALALAPGLRGRRHSFWLGFELAGWLGVAAFVLAACGWPEPTANFISPPVERIGHTLSRPLGIDATSVVRDRETSFYKLTVYAVFPAAITIPLATVALAGGLLTGWVRLRVVVERFAGRRHRPALATLCCLALFLLLPCLGLELLMRRTIDPFNVRLADGRLAVLDMWWGKDSWGNSFNAVFEDRTNAQLPNNTRVRIDNDHFPALIQPLNLDGSGPLVDKRAVSVTIAEAPWKDKVTVLPRCFLRPVR